MNQHAKHAYFLVLAYSDFVNMLINQLIEKL